MLLLLRLFLCGAVRLRLLLEQRVTLAALRCCTAEGENIPTASAKTRASIPCTPRTSPTLPACPTFLLDEHIYYGFNLRGLYVYLAALHGRCSRFNVAGSPHALSIYSRMWMISYPYRFRITTPTNPSGAVTASTFLKCIFSGVPDPIVRLACIHELMTVATFSYAG